MVAAVAAVLARAAGAVLRRAERRAGAKLRRGQPLRSFWDRRRGKQRVSPQRHEHGEGALNTAGRDGEGAGLVAICPRSVAHTALG